MRAAVGSAGLQRAGGWIDMTRALRSPGSALKPFIYAAAFDNDFTPSTIIDDSPVSFETTIGGEQVEFRHLLVGEVWLVGG